LINSFRTSFEYLFVVLAHLFTCFDAFFKYAPIVLHGIVLHGVARCVIMISTVSNSYPNARANTNRCCRRRRSDTIVLHVDIRVAAGVSRERTAIAGAECLRSPRHHLHYQAGSLAGYTYNTKIVSDNGSGTLTMLDACPFVGA
jgi:hypothetical protein